MSRQLTQQKKVSAVSEADFGHLAAFRHALREFLHFSEEAALAAGVQPQQYQAMLAIRGFRKEGWLTVGELAEQLKTKHHSTVGLVNRMEANGFVAKSHSSGDRRQVLVRLTAMGRRMLGKLSAVHKAELARIEPGLRNIFAQLKITS